MSGPGKLPEQKRPFQDIRLSAYELSVALRREFKGHLIHQPAKVLNGAVHACFDDPCRNPDPAICFLDCISGMGMILDGCMYRHVSIPALFSEIGSAWCRERECQ